MATLWCPIKRKLNKPKLIVSAKPFWVSSIENTRVKIIDHVMQVCTWDNLIPFLSKLGQRYNWQHDCIDSFPMIKASVVHQTHHQPKGSELFPLSHRHFGPQACRQRSQHRCQGPQLPGRGRGTWPTADLTGWIGSESAGTGTIRHLERETDKYVLNA